MYFLRYLEKEALNILVLKETIDLNWSKIECQKMPIILQSKNQVKESSIL